MNEVIMELQSNPRLMLLAIIAVVVLLVIVLTIVVSTMRVKTYKDRWWNLMVENKEKDEHIAMISNELKASKIQNSESIQELSEFKEIKNRLERTQEDFISVQHNFNDKERELGQLYMKLKKLEAMHESLVGAHRELQEKNKILFEDNGRYRVNNARLLMKLESGDKSTQTHELREEV